MNSINYLINFFFDAYLMIVLLRFWLQLVRADFYNPISQFITKVTHPILRPLRRVIPGWGGVDVASLVLALFVAASKYILLLLIYGQDLAIGNILLISAQTLIFTTLDLIKYTLFLYAILSWVSQGYNPLQALLNQLLEPLLAPIRRAIPPIGGLDLSVLIAIVFLHFLPYFLSDIFSLFK